MLCSCKRASSKKSKGVWKRDIQGLASRNVRHAWRDVEEVEIERERKASVKLKGDRREVSKE